MCLPVFDLREDKTMDNFGAEIEKLLDPSACACTRCGYDLRGTIVIPQNHCPECGKAVKLSIAPERRGQAAWFVMVVAAAFLLGGSSLYLVYVYSRNLAQWAGSVEVFAMWLTAPIALALVLWLGIYRQWMTNRSKLSIRLAALTISLVILMFLFWWVAAPILL